MSTFDPTPISFGGPAPAPAAPVATATVTIEAPVAPVPSFGGSLAITETATAVETVVTYDYAAEQAAEIERLVANHSRADLLTTEAFTDWHQLRDYVVAAIETRIGNFPRNPVKEKSIFSSFFDRWGAQAEGIARYAVEVSDCWWNNSPLSVNRFTKGSDPYFAEVIAQRL